MSDQNSFCRRIMFNRTWDLLSSRWKVYLIYLLAAGPVRFGALRRQCPAVSRVTFTTYLRQLEREGLVFRTPMPEETHAVEYSLSERGRRVLPAVTALIEWGFAEEGDEA